MKQISGNSQINSLTGFRWLAALLVFISHFAPPLSFFQSGPPSAFIANGHIGVTAFFVLSGFILTVTYVRTLNVLNPKSVWKYAVSRVARIYPLYIFCLIVIVLQSTVTGQSISQILILQHLLAIQTWSPDASIAFSINSPAWSVGVEFFLYACFPFLLLMLRSFLRSFRGSVAVFCFGLAFTFVWWVMVIMNGQGDLPTFDPNSAHRWLYRFPVSRLGDFIQGMGLAGAFLNYDWKLLSQKVLALCSSISLLLILFLMSLENCVNSAASWDLLFVFPIGIFILSLAVAPNSLISSFLSSRTSIKLGEWSFAFYLIHVPIGNILIGIPNYEVDTLWATTWWISILVILVAISFGLHVLIERPCRTLIRKYLIGSN